MKTKSTIVIISSIIMFIIILYLLHDRNSLISNINDYKTTNSNFSKTNSELTLELENCKIQNELYLDFFNNLLKKNIDKFFDKKDSSETLWIYMEDIKLLENNTIEIKYNDGHLGNIGTMNIKYKDNNNSSIDYEIEFNQLPQ
jgi:hypothetical protein